MKVSISGFRLLKRYAKKTKCKIKISTRCGCPFFVYKKRKRVAYILGILFFVSILYTLSSFVWLINVEGNERISSGELLEYCKSQGLSVGSFKPKINLLELETALKNNFDDISWVTVQVNGTLATIKLTETIPKAEIPDLTTPCNIVSKSNAIITEISTKSGTPLVKAGDTVMQGDILVSSALYIKENDVDVLNKYTHASADIRARLWKNMEFSIPLEYSIKNYTGNVYKSYEIVILDKIFKKNEISHNNCDKIVFEKQLSLGKNYPLPIKIITNEYNEYIPQKQTLTEDSAKHLAENKISKHLLENISADSDIIDKKIFYSIEKNQLKVTAVVEVVENIGLEQPITEGSTNINGTTENTNQE